MGAVQREKRQNAVGGKVEADADDAVVRIEFDGDQCGDGRADDGGEIIRQRRAGVAHFSGEQFGQQRRHRAEGHPHQRHADNQERQHARRRTVGQKLRHQQAERQHRKRYPDQEAAAADFVGVDTGKADERAEHHRTDHQKARKRVGRNTQTLRMAELGQFRR